MNVPCAAIHAHRRWRPARATLVSMMHSSACAGQYGARHVTVPMGRYPPYVLDKPGNAPRHSPSWQLHFEVRARMTVPFLSHRRSLLPQPSTDRALASSALSSVAPQAQDTTDRGAPPCCPTRCLLSVVSGGSAHAVWPWALQCGRLMVVVEQGCPKVKKKEGP